MKGRRRQRLVLAWRRCGPALPAEATARHAGEVTRRMREKVGATASSGAADVVVQRRAEAPGALSQVSLAIEAEGKANVAILAVQAETFAWGE